MKKQTHLLVLPFALATACATMGGSGKGSSAPFQGEAATVKRRAEIANAGQAGVNCMKVKPGTEAIKGGVFAVVADAAGKLQVEPMKWDGPEAVKQCIIDIGNKTTVSPLPGPSVGALWEYTPPGEKPQTPKAPDDLAVKMQPIAALMQDAVTACGQRLLGMDFGATIEVSYYLAGDGKGYAPTVVMSDAKDGSFDGCVQSVISKTQFPQFTVDQPFPTTSRFKIGQYGDTQHK